MFTTDEGAGSRPSSRAGFRRPGEEGRFDEAVGLRRTASNNSLAGGQGMSTPTQPGRGSGRFDQSQPSTPIPSVLTPHHLLNRNPLSTAQIPKASTSGSSDPGRDPTASTPVMTLSGLNAMQAKVLRAKLSDDPAAAELEENYNREMERYRAHAAGGDAGGGMWEGNKSGVEGQLGRDEEVGKNGSKTEIQVLPTLDARGQLYDIGTGDGTEKPLLPGNRRPKLNGKVNYVFNVTLGPSLISQHDSSKPATRLESFSDTTRMMTKPHLASSSGRRSLALVLAIRKVWMRVWLQRSWRMANIKWVD